MSNYSESKFSEDPNSSWYKAFNYIKPGSRVLDIGCSSGTFGRVLIQEKNCVVDGVELDKGDFDEAKKHLRKVYRLNIESDSLELLTDTYDFIYFGDVIEHLVTPGRTLKRIKTLLKPTGKIVFSVPNMAHLSVRLMLLAGDFTRGETGLLDKTHLHFYTFTELQRVFREGGYEIVNMDPVLKDLPRELVNQQLADIGLKNNKATMEFFNSTDASIYQYVGICQPATTTPKTYKLDTVSPVDLFQTYLDNTIKHYKAVVAHKEQENEALINHISSLEKKITEYQKTLSFRVKSKVNRLRDSRTNGNN